LVAEESLLQAVEVQTEPVAERQRQITAKIQIPHSVEQVWQVLTAYEALADLSQPCQSRRLEHPQVFALSKWYQRLLRFNFSACDSRLRGKIPHEINFNMVEGDLKLILAAGGSNLILSDQMGTKLCYSVRVGLSVPCQLQLERRLCSDLRSIS